MAVQTFEQGGGVAERRGGGSSGRDSDAAVRLSGGCSIVARLRMRMLQLLIPPRLAVRLVALHDGARVLVGRVRSVAAAGGSVASRAQRQRGDETRRDETIGSTRIDSVRWDGWIRGDGSRTADAAQRAHENRAGMREEGGAVRQCSAVQCGAVAAALITASG